MLHGCRQTSHGIFSVGYITWSSALPGENLSKFYPHPTPHVPLSANVGAPINYYIKRRTYNSILCKNNYFDPNYHERLGTCSLNICLFIRAICCSLWSNITPENRCDYHMGCHIFFACFFVIAFEYHGQFVVSAWPFSLVGPWFLSWQYVHGAIWGWHFILPMSCSCLI